MGEDDGGDSRPRHKVCFALPTSASPSPARPTDAHDGLPQGIHYITHFDGLDSSLPPNKFIPPLPDSWYLKILSGILPVTGTVPVTAPHAPASILSRPFSESHRETSTTVKRDASIDLGLQRLRQDVDTLPLEASLDAYEMMPVEDFGEALLRGMGWEKGKPIGLNSKVVVFPVESVKKVGRRGLGADEFRRNTGEAHGNLDVERENNNGKGYLSSCSEGNPMEERNSSNGRSMR